MGPQTLLHANITGCSILNQLEAADRWSRSSPGTCGATASSEMTAPPRPSPLAREGEQCPHPGMSSPCPWQPLRSAQPLRMLRAHCLVAALSPPAHHDSSSVIQGGVQQGKVGSPSSDPSPKTSTGGHEQPRSRCALGTSIFGWITPDLAALPTCPLAAQARAEPPGCRSQTQRATAQSQAVTRQGSSQPRHRCPRLSQALILLVHMATGTKQTRRAFRWMT